MSTGSVGQYTRYLDLKNLTHSFSQVAGFAKQSFAVWNIPCVIIGVAPKGFVGIWDDTPPADYIPITTYAGSNPSAEDRANYYTRPCGLTEPAPQPRLCGRMDGATARPSARPRAGAVERRRLRSE